MAHSMRSGTAMTARKSSSLPLARFRDAEAKEALEALRNVEKLCLSPDIYSYPSRVLVHLKEGDWRRAQQQRICLLVASH